MSKTINFRTYYKDWVNYFKNINEETPELKTIDEIEQTEEWEHSSATIKVTTLCTFIGWLSSGEVHSETSQREFEEVLDYYQLWADFFIKAREEVRELDDELHAIPTKEGKINLLRRKLTNLSQLAVDDESVDYVKNYLIHEIDYWEKYQEEHAGVDIRDKIKWLGTPSQFGYIFLELVKQGFIEPTPHNGDPNFTELARRCFKYFDIDTTPENLKKEMNPNKNTLSDTKRAKFTIPDKSDLN